MLESGTDSNSQIASRPATMIPSTHGHCHIPFHPTTNHSINHSITQTPYKYKLWMFKCEASLSVFLHDVPSRSLCSWYLDLTHGHQSEVFFVVVVVGIFYFMPVGYWPEPLPILWPQFCLTFLLAVILSRWILTSEHATLFCPYVHEPTEKK